MPAIVTVFEVLCEPVGTSNCGTNANGSGARSQASVVTLNGFDVPATVTVTVEVVAHVDEAVCRSVNDCPGFIPEKFKQ